MQNVAINEDSRQRTYNKRKEGTACLKSYSLAKQSAMSNGRHYTILINFRKA